MINHFDSRYLWFIFLADIQAKLEKLNMNLQQCWKSLLNHLERRRQKFPRFYFLSTEDVLHIVCNGVSLLIIFMLRFVCTISDSITLVIDCCCFSFSKVTIQASWIHIYRKFWKTLVPLFTRRLKTKDKFILASPLWSVLMEKNLLLNRWVTPK